MEIDLKQKVKNNRMASKYMSPSIMPTGIRNAIDNIFNKNFDYLLENVRVYYGEGIK